MSAYSLCEQLKGNAQFVANSRHDRVLDLRPDGAVEEVQEEAHDGTVPKRERSHVGTSWCFLESGSQPCVLENRRVGGDRGVELAQNDRDTRTRDHRVALLVGRGAQLQSNSGVVRTNSKDVRAHSQREREGVGRTCSCTLSLLTAIFAVPVPLHEGRR